ncbi:MAG: pyridoxal phosphate-dependent aminotransferase, partial [Hyphomicrobium sp.]
VSVPFVGPEALARARDRPFKARLGANESIFGPSPKAIAVMRDAASECWMYADPESFELESAIARFHGVGVDNVVVGEGIDGLLGLTVKIAVEPGAVVVTSDGAYPTFNFHVEAHGGRLVKVPFRDDHEDLEALLDRAKAERAAVLYVSNPNNPMGSWWHRDEIARLIAALPGDLLLILDEAYSDTAPADAVLPIDVGNPQVLRFRTFSKAYGLAGARVGYAVGDAALVQTFEKVRNHYGMGRTGQLGALAALADQDYLRAALGRIARARDRIAAIAGDNGLAPLPSATNFVAIDCGRDGAHAQAVLDGVLARDVFIRKPGVAPLDRCIRVSCGPDADLDLFAEALHASLRDARAG